MDAYIWTLAYLPIVIGVNPTILTHRWTKDNQKWFCVVNRPVNWTEANQTCHNMSAILATFTGNNHELYKKLESDMSLNKSIAYWTNITDKCNNDTHHPVLFKTTAKCKNGSDETYLICETKHPSIADCGQSINCKSAPLSPTNGNVTGTSFLEGDSVTYKCNVHYTLIGPDVATCQTNGTWTSATPICKREWIATYRREFFVNDKLTNYTIAAKYCQSVNASLVSFTNPFQYLNISKVLGLQTGSYWMGVLRLKPLNSCPLLNVNTTDGNTLVVKKCSIEQQSICSRAANISDILNDPAFVKMLEEMKIDAKNTTRARRQHMSIWDNRRSAKILGQFGIFIIAASASAIVLCDMPRLINFCTCKKKKVHVTNEKAQRVKGNRTKKRVAAVRRKRKQNVANTKF